MQFASSNTPENLNNLTWLQTGLGLSRGWDNKTSVTMGVFGNAGIVAVVAYHDWNPDAGTIAMSAYSSSKKWLNRDVLFKMHEYPFVQIGCQAVVLQVSEHNKNMLRIAKAYGYEQHRIPRLRGKNEAEIINILSDETWRESRFTRNMLQTVHS